MSDQKGTVPCPFKGCEETAALYTMAARTDDERRRRRAGQFYCKCPVHGTLGLNASPALRDYFADKATVWGPEGKPAGNSDASDQQTLPPAQAPKPAPATSGERSPTSANGRTPPMPPPAPNVPKPKPRGLLDW